MIDKETVDKIFDVANIVDVVSDFVSLKKRGVNFMGCCPFHNEKTPSFTVSPSKNIYKCFGCGKGGNSVNFVMEHEQMSYYEALKYLAKKYNIEVREKEFTPEEKERNDDRESMLVLNDFAKKTFIANMRETDEGRNVGLKYFRERDFSEKTINDFELGFSLSDRHYFTKLALANGYKQKYLVSTGLSIQHDDGEIFDRFSNRVMFPIHNLTGRVIGFGGRVLDARTKGVSIKYMNSPQSEIYDKSRSLYGIYQAKASITRNNKCFLVEGYTDVLSMHQSGIENVVASNGTALTTEQIRLIHRFTENVTVLYDGDAAGIHAALRGIDMVLAEQMNVKVLLLPDGEDPDSFARSHSESELLEFIEANETDFILFKTNLLLKDAQGDPVKMAQLIGDIVTSISVIPDAIKRSTYVKECAIRLKVDESLLHREVNKRIRKNQEQQYRLEEQRQRQEELQMPSPSTLNNQTIDEDVCRKYEAELLKLLLIYGNDILFVVAEDDKPSIDIRVGDYIDKELKNNDLSFKIPICKKIYDLYFEAYYSAQMPDISMFENYHDAEVSKFIIDLTFDKYTLSKLWEKQNPYLKPEETQLKEVIDHALNGYKLEIVKQTLKDFENQLRNSNCDVEKETQILNDVMTLTSYKNRLSNYLERVMC